MPFTSRTAAVASLAFLAGVTAVPTAAAQCGTPDASAARQVLNNISAARAAAGLPALRPNKRLVRVARGHARRMALSGSIWHDDLSRWAAGRAVAQNVAYGGSGREAFTAMWNSRPHRSAMMSRRYRFVGIGAAASCSGEIMVSVDLMGPVRRRR